MPTDTSTILGLAVALIIGLVVGAEREQRMAVEPTTRRTAGIRTFTLTALLGALGVLLGTPALVTFGAGVAVFAVVAYALDDRTDPGLTTEIALLVTFALGALAISQPMLALSVGLTAAILLAFRARIHAMVRDVLTPVELRDALIVASAALVVLPLLPSHPIDPWGVLVPFTLWRLVVVVLVIHLVAHMAQRVLGPTWGAPIAGLASGFVSSVATIGAMAARAKANPSTSASATAAAAASNVATFVQLAILVGAVSPTLLVALAPPLVAGALVAAAIAGWLAFRAAKSGADGAASLDAHAVNVRGAMFFACAVTAVTIGASLVGRWLGSSGLLVGAALAGLADTHAPSASIASVEAAHQLDTATALTGVLLCVTTNSATKIAMAFAAKPPRAFSLAITAQVVLVALAAWLVWAL